jgi:broad specificity phosphatase PhoE
MWIYLVRHAQTDGNAKRIVQLPDTPLSVDGERQAEEFAQAYLHLPISTILSSDYARARATALVLHRHEKTVMLSSKLLRERNFGDLRGVAYRDIPNDIFALNFKPPSGESHRDFVVRVGLAWQNVINVAKSNEGELLVMTHGLVVRCILTEILKLPTGVLNSADIQNTCVTKINKHNIADVPLICDVSHLSAQASDKRE